MTLPASLTSALKRPVQHFAALIGMTAAARLEGRAGPSETQGLVFDATPCAAASRPGSGLYAWTVTDPADGQRYRLTIQPEREALAEEQEAA
jgi:hypothetical protein